MHSSRKTQWDHPKFQEIQKGLKECNIIKYASYRTAAKIAMLNRALYMHHIRLGLIAGVFERHGFKSMENKIVLECSELEAILFDVFFAAQKETSCQFDVGLVTELMINLLLNIYDRKRKGTLQVLSTKLVLVVLCSARLREKYQYMFGQLADHNRCISRKKLENLLRNFTQIAEYLSEACAFGSDLVPEAVDICFQQSQGTLGVTEDIFITWLLHEPQLLHWLPTFHRMKAAEKVIHDVKCRTCKMYPLTGLRYQCLQCLKYNQCQSCFFMCKTSRRHKLKHLMQEYWSETSSRDTTRAFFKMILNKMRRNSSSLRQLSIQPHDSGHDTSDSDLMESSDKGRLDNEDLFSQTILYGSKVNLQILPHLELHSIICHLEEQNRQFQQDIEELCNKEGNTSVEQRVKSHKATVEDQIKRLKLLKSYLTQINPPNSPRTMRHLESTPVITLSQRYGRLGVTHALDNISPILHPEDESKLSLEVKTLGPSPLLRSAGGKPDIGCVNSGSCKLRKLSPDMCPDDDSSLSEVSSGDISKWYADQVSSVATSSGGISAWFQETQVGANRKLDNLRSDLDVILEKLEKMLTTNFCMDEPANVETDDSELQKAATEMENLLSGLIEGVEKQNRLSNELSVPSNESDNEEREEISTVL
uniref:ZZ-type domain-containing protein n=1 Tax=Timema bartmani TaxID=61472 RepID=A0A7R9EYI6_9NEOP|nr:unnamed protein product [Timema bartmani]